MVNTVSNETNEVVVCPECNGSGKSYAFDSSGRPLIHGGKAVIATCPVCDGQRVLIKKTTVEYYAVSQQVFSEANKEKNGGFLAAWRKK